MKQGGYGQRGRVVRQSNEAGYFMKSGKALKVGDRVEVLPLVEIMATLDGRGQLEGLPFMPEIVPYCGQRFKITAVMPKICGGGGGMRAVAGAPLLLLDELRCDGSAHGRCSRLCTLLWKAAWLKPVDGPSLEPAGEPSEAELDWPFPTRTGSDTYTCQATGLPWTTAPMSIAEKLGKALADIAAGEWSLGAFLKVCIRAVAQRLRSLGGRAMGRGKEKRHTPTETLALQPGEWVRTKSLKEIAATLDGNNRNRGLEFSVYMVPFCGKRYRVKARMGKFIDERTGKMKELENTVILEGVYCGGETASGICRRAECLYWREIWLQRAESPEEAVAD